MLGLNFWKTPAREDAAMPTLTQIGEITAALPKRKVYPAEPDPELAKDPTLADYGVGQDLRERGELAAYAGEFVAILDGKVVGHGPDGFDLREQVAERLGIPPCRPAILRVFSEEDLIIKLT